MACIHAVDQSMQALEVLLGQVRGCKPGRIAFKNAPNGIKLLETLQIDAFDVDASVRNDGYEIFGFQTTQRFAHRDDGGVEVLGKEMRHQFLPGRGLPPEYGMLDSPVNLFGFGFAAYGRF
jgi:hypothetical protein